MSEPPGSPLPMRMRLDALHGAGWTYLGLDRTDLSGRELSVSQLADEISDRGLRCVELEFFMDWWVAAGSRRVLVEKALEDLLSAADLLHCHLIKIGSPFHGDHESTPSALVSGMNRLAGRAGGTGVRFALEPMPIAQVGDPIHAQELLADVAPAVGLCIDVWHVARAGMSYAELGEVVDPERIFRVELSDGSLVPRVPLREDSVDHRLQPGDGDLDVPTFVATLEQMGWSGVWGVEVLSRELRAAPLSEGLRAVRRATLKTFERAWGRTRRPTKELGETCE